MSTPLRARLRTIATLWIPALWVCLWVGVLSLGGPALGAPALAAQPQQLVLGSDGTVYRLLEGAYGDLFPEGGETHADHPVLALDVQRAEGVTERWLVPGTESVDPEGSSSVVLERNLGVYVLWETLFNGLHPQLHLTSFDGVEWSEVIEISNGPFSYKGSPQLEVTREHGRNADEPDRTVLHVTWWEESGGAVLKRYAPIIIQDGSYIGWSPVIGLGGLLAADPEAELYDVPGLEHVLTLRSGKNERTVMVGFLNPSTHRLSAVEIEVLPGALGSLADGARAHIVILGSSVKTHGELAQGVKEKLLELGHDFHQATLSYIAGEVAARVAESPDELTLQGIESIADQARAHIVILGSQFGPDGLVNAGEPQILEIGQSSAGGGPFHYVKVSVVADLEAPEVGGPAELILSESGQSMILSWEEEGAIHYLENIEEGWSEPSVIELSEELDRETAYRMLGERVHAD